MHISMVIPCYTADEDLESVAMDAAHSYRDQVDELIIAEDGGNYSKELAGIADVYIYSKENQGFTANVNNGWRVARGDYCMIVNSDTTLKSGKLSNLCIPGTVTSPLVRNHEVPHLSGAFFVVPKTVRDQRGLLWEDFKMYYSDSEYDLRVDDIFKQVPRVEIHHQICTTVRATGKEGVTAAEDKAKFEEFIRQGEITRRA